MPEPINSWMIGWVEIALALTIFHRALPAMMDISAELDPLPPTGFFGTIGRLFRNDLPLLGTLFAVIRFIGSAIVKRLMVLKLWALAFALGSFGIGRAFGPAYVADDAWLFSFGHYCLISYTALRLLHISRNSDKRWWRHA